MDNFKKYLPSKKFVSIVLIIIILIVLFFAVKGLFSLIKSKTGTKNGPTPMTVGDIVQKDSNNNGIADWEEYLWGLDPSKNGAENKEYILAKKKTLQEKGIISKVDDSKTITDSELLSQQFLATIISLQQTGNLNDESIKSVSEAIGKNIDPTPIPDIYTESMITVQNDSTIANKTYHDAISKLITKYSDANIGSELTFLVQGISNNDPSAFYAAKTVGLAYQSFGKEFVKIPVPNSLASLHLSIANNYEKTGQTVNDLSKTLSDPIVGMKSITNYKKYNDALASDLEKLSSILQ